eukprot:2156836-Prymnesium_polylepis.1
MDGSGSWPGQREIDSIPPSPKRLLRQLLQAAGRRNVGDELALVFWVATRQAMVDRQPLAIAAREHDPPRLSDCERLLVLLQILPYPRLGAIAGRIHPRCSTRVVI